MVNAEVEEEADEEAEVEGGEEVDSTGIDLPGKTVNRRKMDLVLITVKKVNKEDLAEKGVVDLAEKGVVDLVEREEEDSMERGEEDMMVKGEDLVDKEEDSVKGEALDRIMSRV